MNARPRVSRLLYGTLFAMAVATVGLWLVAQLRIDRCLDGGGRWNHETNKCEGRRSGG
jgi:hypothetical protein